MAAATTSFLPGFGFDRSTLALAGGIALVVGLISGFLPSMRTSRMTATEALQELG